MKLMKRLSGLFILFFTMDGFGQGSLTPPGAPAPVMKTLDQLEARTPIGGAATLTQSGSYYLTGNVTNGGVAVSADHVTLDLNGFSIVGSSGNGIAVSSAQNVVVRNGSVQGFDIGVLVSGSSVCRFEKLTVTDSDTIGFYFNGAGGACNGNVVEACTVIGSGERGFHFIGNVGECSFNQVKDCLIGNNSGDGIYFEGQSAGNCNENLVLNSLIGGNADSGIWFNGLGGTCRGNEIRGCQVSGNSYGGIRMQADCNDNRIVDNAIVNNTGSFAGLAVLGSGNLISGNIVKGNTTNYNFSADNQLNLLISEIPETIDWPCTATLTGSLSLDQDGVNGLTVDADHVTIDLAGHTLTGPGAASGSGIFMDSSAGHHHLTVRNGSVRNWLGNQMAGVKTMGYETQVQDVCAYSNYIGFWQGSGSVLSQCRSYKNTWTGFSTGSDNSLTECVATENGGSGISVYEGSVVKQCTAGKNGAHGISAFDGSTVLNCTSEGNSNAGISAEAGVTILGCSVHANDQNGIETDVSCIIESCTVVNSGHRGIDAGDGTRIQKCTVTGSQAEGIVTYNGSSVQDCLASINVEDGVVVVSNCLVSDNQCTSNGYLTGDGAGIRVASYDNRIEGNNATGNDRGIDVDGSGSLIVRNSASGNTINYTIAGNNKVGVIVSAPNSLAISGSTGGAGVGSTDPWANFSF